MRSVSLYAHIPFCAQKCDYCDFFSVPKSGGIPDLYVESLLREASFYADSFGVDSWKTLYIGGGTPSLLSPRQLSSIVCGLGAMRPFSRDAEITVEMNPESVRAELIDACASSGVNRISLGIQALDEQALSRVHRLGSPRMALDALSLLEKTWRGRLSVDFIAGLPGQTRDSFKNQFGTVFSFKNIDHISLYTLTIEDGTPLGKKIARGETDFSFDRADSMWILGRNILEKNGFLQYEVSNFARPGFESRHNKTYWHLEDYVGIGAGASGTMYEKSLRWNNRADIGAYCNFWAGGAAELPALGDDLSFVRECEILCEKTMMFEFLMMGFRLLEGVSEGDFFARFKKELSAQKNSDGVPFGEIFESWKKRRLLRIQGKSPRRFSLNRRGILLLNRFLEELL